MPYGHAQVIMQLVDFDDGDDTWYGTWLDMWQYINERLISFSFSDHERKKDQLKLAFRNDDREMLENPAFVKGQKLAVSWGWPGELAPVRRMVVAKVKGGNPLMVILYDTTQLMDKDKESHSWSGMTYSQIVEEIAGKHGYHGQYLHIEPTNFAVDVTQRRTTDARFMRYLAKKVGFVFFVDASGLHWHRRNLTTIPVRTLIYRQEPLRGDIIEEPLVEANLTRGVSRIRVMARDPLTKQIWEEFGGPDDTELDTLGTDDEMGNSEESKEEQGLRASRLSRTDTRYAGEMTKAETKVLADAMYREVVNKKYKLTLNVIGKAPTGAKVLYDVYGLAKSWDGLFYCKECISDIVGGKFVQKLRLERSLLREVKVAKKRKRGKKEKENTTTLDLQTIALRHKRIITTDSRGEPVIANMWVDENDVAVGGFDYETPGLPTHDILTGEFLGGDEDFGLLSDIGAQSVPPDAGQ